MLFFCPPSLIIVKTILSVLQKKILNTLINNSSFIHCIFKKMRLNNVMPNKMAVTIDDVENSVFNGKLTGWQGFVASVGTIEKAWAYQSTRPCLSCVT